MARRLGLLEELLQRERRRADVAEATLRDLASAEGDSTLVHLVAIWRAQAERDGLLRSLAERVVRLHLKGKPISAAIAAWQKEYNDG